MRIRGSLWIVACTLAFAACASGPRVHFHDRPEDNWKAGERYAMQRDFPPAVRLMDDALANGYQPPLAEVHMRSWVYLQQRDYAGGESWLAAYALARFPRDPMLLQERANFLWRLGRRAEAEQVAREALQQGSELCTAAWIVDRSDDAYRDCTARARQRMIEPRASR
jgi:hypothetical protein